MSYNPDTFNVITNVVTLVGGAAVSALIIYILVQVWRINERLESVLAPKTGIEGFLNMCAQVVEADPDGTCVVNDDGEIVLVNESMEEISGYHRSEMVGQSVELLVPNAFKSIHPSNRETYIASSTNRPMRGLTLRHKRGTEKSVGIRLKHYTDTSGGYTIAKVRVPDDELHTSGEWKK